MIVCSNCQTQNPAGTLMCNQCLMPLTPPASPQGGGAGLAAGPAGAPRLRWVQIDNLQPTGCSLQLPDLDFEGEILVGRNDLANAVIVDLDLTRLGGIEHKVSRKHARLRYAGRQVTLEDWESQFGTWLNKQKLATGQREPIKAGDEIRLAQLTFKVEVLSI
ncbi:MAG: FHA domain-containing protein [Candidatus Sericytochromatia bacterium]